MSIFEEIKDLQEKFSKCLDGHKLNPATKVYAPNLLRVVYGTSKLDQVNDKRLKKGKKPLEGNQLYANKMNDNNSLDVMSQVLELQEKFNELFEGRQEGENNKDFKQRLASELMSSIADKALEAHRNAIDIYNKKGCGEESRNATEEAKKEYAKLKKVEDIKSNINCAFQEQIAELTEAYQSLLEEVPVEKQDISPNKIKRKKKDSKGEPVEVVSVADELFPYEGNAKQQYNQKIIAKINDMIEGTATLEDLIQLVRQKKTVKESLEEAISLMEAFLNEKNANVEKKHQWEINQAQAKRPKDEHVGDLGTVSGIKKSNQNTIRGLKRILKRTKNSKYSIGRESDAQALESGISKVARVSRDALGRKDPENPYRDPYIWSKAYEETHGNLNQKAIERKHSNDQGYKKHLQTSIEQEKKINPKLPKPKQEQ